MQENQSIIDRTCIKTFTICSVVTILTGIFLYILGNFLTKNDEENNNITQIIFIISIAATSLICGIFSAIMEVEKANCNNFFLFVNGKINRISPAIIEENSLDIVPTHGNVL